MLATLSRGSHDVSAVTQLVPDSFTGTSTTGNWLSGGSGTGGHVACLTANNTSPVTTIPRCSDTSDTNGNGALRLTRAQGGSTGYVLLNTPVNASDGLDIKFSIHQYGGQGWGAAAPMGPSSPEARPGDGLSFFLIDGTASPSAPGPYSGSLGYASDHNRSLPGIVGGYVGVGFDRFGNNSWNQIGSGGPMSTLHDINYANSIVVRGGAAADYPYVAGHRANGGSSSLSGTNRANSERQVHITVSTANLMTVRVSYDQGVSWVTEFSNIDLNTINGAGSFPDTFKLGFAASTGGAYQTHEIRSLNITTLPPDISTDVTGPSALTRGQQAVFTATVANSAAAGSTTDPITVTSTLPAGIVPSAASGTGWNCNIAGQLVTCTRASGVDNNETLPAITITADVGMSVATSAAIVVESSVNEDSDTSNDGDTLNVTIPNLPSAQNDSYGTLVPATGGTIGAVLANDTFNGAAITPGTVTVATLPNPEGVTINSSGVLTVPAGLTPGSHTIGYRICETAAPSNCSDATVTFSVDTPIKPIIAVDDTLSSAQAGGNVGNVLTGDTLDGVAATTSTVTISATDPNSTGITVGSNGDVTVPSDLAPGSYVIEYEICEIDRPSNCSSAETTVVVTATPIVAGDNDFTTTPLPYGGGTTASVLGNDTLNGAQATSSNVTTSITDDNGTGITINPDGTLSVPAATPTGLRPGTHTVEYQICETAHPSNCTTAEATIEVLPLPLVAAADTLGDVSGRDGGSTSSVLANDTLGGSAITPGDVTVSLTSPPTGVTINSTTGVVSVAPGTPAGNHTITYTVCETIEPTNCSSNTLTLTITAADIETNDNTLPGVNGHDGGNAGSVLTGNTLDGDPINPADVTVTTPGGTPSGITVGSDGSVTVAPGTPAGSHTVSYTVCENLNPANCETGTTTVNVTAAPIVTTSGALTSVDGRDGGSAGSVLTGDTLSGDPMTPSDVTVTTPNGTPTGITVGSNGAVTVAPDTPAGNYTIEYQVCENLNPTNCQTETMTLQVTATPIVTSPNTLTPVDGYDGSSNAGSVLTGNTLGGDPIDSSDVTVTTPSGTPSGVIIGSDGTVSVAPGTPAGNYTIEYQVCENLNPGNCQTGIATLEITAAAIVTSPTTLPNVDGRDGSSNAGSVLTGDTLSGDPINPDDVTVTTPSGTPTGITINGDGVVSVAPGTPAGNHTITYQVCENLNPTNCQTNTVTVNVTAAPLVVNPDDTPDPVVSGPAGNVLDGGTLGGDPINPDDVTITVTDNGGLTGVTIDEDGNVQVPKNTPAGTYPVEYQVCENLNPTNCQTDTITITIEAPVVTANGDTLSPVNTVTGGPAGNVLDNDRLDGQAIDPADVVLTVVGSLPTGITFNTATGDVDVQPGAPLGSYTVTYQMCHVANPSVCSTASFQGEVVQDQVVINIESQPSRPDEHGVVGNIYDLTDVNGSRPDQGSLTGSIANDGGLTGVTIDEDGNIVVPQNAAPGTYTVAYRVCLVSHPTNCQEGTLTVVVPEPDTILGVPNTGVYRVVMQLGSVIAGLGMAVVTGIAVWRLRKSRT